MPSAIIVLDPDPCNNASCLYHSKPVAYSPQQCDCVCETICPSYREEIARPTGERSETFVCSRKRFVKRVQTTRIITLEAVQVCVFEVGDDKGDDVWTGDDEDDNNDDQEN